MNSNVKKIGLVTATAIVVANMVGTGVFTSLGFQLGFVDESGAAVILIDSPFTIIMLWLIGGIIAISGAFSYGELGAAFPRSGGEYHFLTKIYGPLVGFLSGWISLTIGFAAAIAATAYAMGQYGVSVITGISDASLDNPDLIVRLIGVTFVILVSLIHMTNINVISKFQNFFTGLKITLILVLIVCGYILAEPQNLNWGPTDNSWSQMFSAPFAVSLAFVMFAYSGWNASAYIIGEIKNPVKNLPLSLLIGTVIVILLYIPINTVFLYSSPITELVGQVDVGTVAANNIFGDVGGIIMGSLITIGLISAVSSMVWAGPRVTYVMGEDTRILRFLVKKNKNNVPFVSVLFQSIIVIILLFSMSFEGLIFYLGFTLSLSSFVTVLGVIVLRFTQPKLSRPYKTFLFPITNIIFLSVTGWMMYYLLTEKPTESLLGLATVSLGAVVFYLNKFLYPNSKPAHQDEE